MLPKPLPFINLPASFVYLLKSHFKGVSPGQDMQMIQGLINQDLSFKTIIEKCTFEFSQGKSFKDTLIYMGWFPLRERLSAFYLNYFDQSLNAFQINLEWIEDILAFEDQFRFLSFEGLGRNYLLGFYLKVLEIQKSREDKNLNIKFLDQFSSLLPYLQVSKVKQEKADYLILTYYFLHLHFDQTTLMSELKKNSSTNLHHIINQLPEDIKNNFFESMINYSASINEPEIFIYEKL